ncbi:MAG TPA: HD domain-containing phosphohydrolase [Anaerolineales bacterium]|nr:HD domain-containing phosphohydrolase [Anaerolineales bacterium]
MKNSKARAFPGQLWHWLIAPSQKITVPDQRRQAALLSSFLFGTLLLAVVVELITIAFIEWENYTGYRQTIGIAIALGIIYGISRTQRVLLAARLAVIVALAGVYFIGWTEPKSVLGGMFDFMILPLWLGSLYLGLGELAILMVVSWISILVFPLLTPQVTLDQVLVGPFSFVLATSILLIIITQHRNRLELDRRTELAEKEKQSSSEAARAEALLRVAGRLNAQLDLDTLLRALSEEAARALNTPVSVVALYDQRKKAFYWKAATGISPDLFKDVSPFPRALYEQTIKEFGRVFALPDLHIFSRLPNLDLFKRLNLRSLAFATMEYEREIIGSLNVFTLGESRTFTEGERLLLHGLADQAALAITNTRLYKDARRRLEHLQALRAIDIAISSNRDLQETLNVLLEQIMKELQVDAAVILLLDEAKQLLEFGASRGFQTSTLRYTSLRMGEGMAGQAALQSQIVQIRDLKSDPRTLVNAPSLEKEGFVSYFAAPLISQGQVKGVLEIFHRSKLQTDIEWLYFLETLAGQAAIAIENTTLFEDLQRTNDELSKAYDSTIEGWSHALDLRDKETEGHTQRVTELTLELARAFRFSDRELVYIRWGALLHDIGKMGVPDRILLKEGPLTEEEWVIMRQHPVYAHEMLQTIQYLRPALDIPYCHHEKWDGTGYPRGLKGEQIPLAARLFAVVDVWDALRSDRPYRAGWPEEKVREHILSLRGTHFEPVVVDLFFEVFNKMKAKCNCSG